MKAITLADNFAPTWQKLPLQIDIEIGTKSKKTKLRHWEAKQTDFLDFDGGDISLHNMHGILIRHHLHFSEICPTIQQKLSVSLLYLFLWQITLLGVELLSVPTINFPI